jgi:hypothetical protein
VRTAPVLVTARTQRFSIRISSESMGRSPEISDTFAGSRPVNRRRRPAPYCGVDEESSHHGIVDGMQMIIRRSMTPLNP